MGALLQAPPASAPVAPRSNSKHGKSRKVKPTPKQRLDQLDDPEFRRNFTTDQIDAERDRLLKQREHLAGKPFEPPPEENPDGVEPIGGLVGGFCPGSAWVDAVWEEGRPFPPGGELRKPDRCPRCSEPIPCGKRDATPARCPGCRHELPRKIGTLMRRCRCCGAMTPPQNVGSSGHCDDCRIAAMSDFQLQALPSSPGLVDMARLKASRRRGENYPKRE